jgi:hypothetical protein
MPRPHRSQLSGGGGGTDEIELASALDPVLVARSLAHRKLPPGEAQLTSLWCAADCEPRARGPVDVALIELDSWRSRHVEQARRELAPKSLVLLGAAPRGKRAPSAPRHDDLLLLAHNGCVATARFALDTTTEGASQLSRAVPLSERGIAIIAQERTIALLHAEMLARRGLPVALVVATATNQQLHWSGWLRASVRSGRISAVLLALSAIPEPVGLAQLDLRPSAPVALHMLGDRRSPTVHPSAEHPDRPPDAWEVARALGWVVVESLECASEFLRLINRYPKLKHGPVVALGASEVHRRIAVQALHRAGVAVGNDDSSRGASRGAAIVSAGAVDPGPIGDHPHLTFPAPPPRAINRTSALPASEATLSALSAWLRTPPQSTDPEGATTEQVAGARHDANQRLTASSGELDEIELKELLAPFGIAAPRETLTTSASAAADAARNLGPPVTLKAVGTGLGTPALWGGSEPEVRNVSAARQAFRDILHAAREHGLHPALRGILVSERIETRVVLDCAVHAIGALRLLQLQLRCGAAYLGRRQSVRCPLTEQAAGELAGLLISEAHRALAPWQPPRQRERKQLGQFLLQISVAGAELTRSLRWLRLATVALPAAGRPALVLDAAASRQRG